MKNQDSNAVQNPFAIFQSVAQVTSVCSTSVLESKYFSKQQTSNLRFVHESSVTTKMRFCT